MTLKKIVDGILDKHEENEARKKEEQFRKAEELKIKRTLTAKAVQTFLVETVKPVFGEVEMLLSGRGYKVEVTTASRKDHSVRPEQEYFMEVTLSVSKGRNTGYSDNKLSYKGSFDEEVIVVETVYSNQMPKKRNPSPISQFKVALIEKDVESFLEKAFSC